jgi:PAS domain S-box-containing protein
MPTESPTAPSDQALRLSELNYRRLFETAQDGILILDADTGRVNDVNPFLIDLLGFTRGEMVGRTVGELSPFKDIVSNQAMLELLQKDGYVRYHDLPLETKDDRKVDVEFVSNTYQVGAKKVIQCNIRDITGRKRETEEASRMAMVVRDSNDAITTQDFEGRITAWNRGAVLMYGYSEAEALAENIERLTAPGKVEEQKDFVRRLLAGEAVTSLETQRVTKDGRILDVWMTVTELVDRDGKPIGIASTERDITGRNQAERALSESNEYLENLFKYANAPIIVWNAEGKIIRFNHASEEIAGLKAEEVLGKGLDLLFAEDQRERAMGIVRRAGAGERFDLVELPIHHTSGSQRTVLWNSAPIFGADKKKQTATIAQGQDISERKRAEAALRESEEQFRTMANSMSQLAWIARADGFIFWYNQRWYEYTGTTPEQMEGWGWQSVQDPKVLPKVMENWAGAIATGQPFEMEFPLRGADGRFRDFLTRVQPLMDAEGRVVQWFGTNTDVVALKEAEEVLRGANFLLEGRVAERTEELKRNRDELAAANKELESFAYSVSHDLRAPLRSIDGFSRILLEDYATKLDEDGRDSLNRIRAATQRMAQLIDDLLNLSRVTRAEMQRERVDLSALAREVAAALRQQEPHRTVEFLAAGGVVVEGDPHLLRVALENLLGNAWKFTGRREGARIEFGTVEQDGQISYFVRDNGAGFDAAYVGKLFGAFQRLHSSTEFPGTGIGLATVQRIVHRHGGRVWADGAVDKGATFYFNLGSEPSSPPETS